MTGDILVQFEGAPVTNIDDLQKLLTEEKIGRPITLGVLRKGKMEAVQVIPGILPE